MPFAPYPIPEGGDQQAGWNHDISAEPVAMLFKNEGKTVYKSVVGLAFANSRSPRRGGKWYVEVRVAGASSLSWAVGPQSYAESLGSFVNSAGYVARPFGVSGATFSAIVPGNTIGIAFDGTNSLVWYRVNGGVWNNNATHNPDTGVGGIQVHPVGYTIQLMFQDQTAEWIINTGPDFQSPIPASFNPWYVRARKPDGWDTVNANPEGGMLLSNGNRTITTEADDYWGQAELVSVTTHRVSSRSKRYAEISLTATDGSPVIEEGHFGIMDMVGDGLDPYMARLNFFTGTIIAGAYAINTPFDRPFPTGTVMGMAVHFNARKLWIKVGSSGWNNAVLGLENPVTNTGGAPIVGEGEYGVDVFLNSLTSRIYSATINTGTSPFALGLPSGFEAWFSGHTGAKQRRYRITKNVKIDMKKRKLLEARVDEKWFEPKELKLKTGWDISG